MNDILTIRFQDYPGVTVNSDAPHNGQPSGWSELTGIGGDVADWSLFIAALAFENEVWVQLTDNEPHVYFWPLALVW